MPKCKFCLCLEEDALSSTDCCSSESIPPQKVTRKLSVAFEMVRAYFLAELEEVRILLVNLRVNFTYTHLYLPVDNIHILC